MEASKTYDLLPDEKKNDIFQVTFDLFTPRPHFILLPKSGKKLPKDDSLKTKEKIQLIQAASDMLFFSKIDCGTLSIRRGSWISQSSQRPHFHLCVDTMKYLEIFKLETDKVLRVGAFESYAAKAKLHPEKYYEEDVKGIKKIIKNGDSLAEGQNTSGNRFHPKHPKIGFLGKRTVKDLENILIQMEEYAVTKKLGGPNEGFHLCLNFGSGSDSEWNLPKDLPEGVGVAGYILVSGPRFYQLCPEGSRKAWFEAFEKVKFKVET